MKFIADFHIHSHYSIATSKQLNPEHIDYWAKIKGIKIVGTGDFTHPGWIKEIKKKLEPAEDGLYKLKDKYRNLVENSFENLTIEPRFILTSEISSIYKKNGKVRKVHNLIFAPDFETVIKIQNQIKKIGGNIESDGRPILGLDSRDLLEIALNASDKILFVPAHIWTPWFSVLGSKSGFDSIDECFSDLSEHIFAVETGLSSDPAMNWLCSFLDKYTLLSNSDAHSPEKLGRNANLFDTNISYESIVNSIKDKTSKEFLGTIDLYPQEGKYHFDGHRKCGICQDPLKTLENDLCPICGKKMTIGVLHRIRELADRTSINNIKQRKPYLSIITLKDILSEIAGVGPKTKKVSKLYNSLIKKLGTEIDILLNLPINRIRELGGDLVAEAIFRMREKKVIISEGFDGQFGKIRVFENSKLKKK